MKNFIKLFALAVVILGFSATSFGQSTYTATATATAKAEIKQGITITKPAAGTTGSDLNFGQIYTDGSAGTVTVAPTTSTTATGSAGITPVATTAYAAKFTLTSGGTALAYSIDVNPKTLTVTSGANSMTVDNIAIGGAATGSLTVPEVRYVGGQLHLGAGQAPGVYSTSDVFTVTVGWD